MAAARACSSDLCCPPQITFPCIHLGAEEIAAVVSGRACFRGFAVRAPWQVYRCYQAVLVCKIREQPTFAVVFTCQTPPFEFQPYPCSSPGRFSVADLGTQGGSWYLSRRLTRVSDRLQRCEKVQGHDQLRLGGICSRNPVSTGDDYYFLPLTKDLGGAVSADKILSSTGAALLHTAQRHHLVRHS